MIKYHFKTIIITVALIMNFPCIYGQNKPCGKIGDRQRLMNIANHTSNLNDIKNEDVVNLNKHPKEPDIGRLEIEDCKDYLKTKRFLRKLPIKWREAVAIINREHLLKLYEKAKKMNNQAHYITGLKMEFGLDKNKEVSLIYRPVKFFDRGVINDTTYNYESVEGGMYRYEGGTSGFKLIDYLSREELIQTYKSKIRIKHSEILGDGYNSFIEGEDVESVIFSFQEIFALMYDNREDCANHNIFEQSNDSILIYSAIQKDTVNPNLSTKHSLLLSLKEYDKYKKRERFEDKFANLGRLCPPNCVRKRRFTFILE